MAAHGFKTKSGGVQISDLLFEIGERSKSCNITGVLLGSCFVGENSSAMQVFIEGTKIKWCAGYASSASWLPSTMIDCSILSHTLGLELDDFSDRDWLIECFADSIEPFARDFEIGSDYQGCPVKLRDSLRFVVQPTGQGKKAKEVSCDVFRILEKQINSHVDEASVRVWLGQKEM